MRCIITRPQPECSVWVEAMRSQALPAVPLPLIDIAPVPFLWNASARYDAFVFVSRSAVEGFFHLQSVASLQAARCLVVGLGTRAALIQRGLAANRIDAPSVDAAQFDSEALWRVIGAQSWKGGRVCVVRGSNYLGEAEGRAWLADKLIDVGASVDFLTTYQRRLPVLSEASNAIVQYPEQGDVWVFSSSQAVQHVKLLLPSQDWSQSRAVATHDRILIAAKGVGFGKVAMTRPVLADVMEALKMQERQIWL